MNHQNPTQGFCCTCLKVCAAKDKLINLNSVRAKDISYKFKLKSCVPEMVLENIDNSFLCTPCLNALDTAYTFRCMCLRNEGKLAEFRQNCNNLVVKNCNNFSGVKIKQEVIEPPEEVFDNHHEVFVAALPQTRSTVEEEDPLGDLEHTNVRPTNHINIETTSFNPFGTEVQLLRVDKGVKQKVALPQIIPRKTSELLAQVGQVEIAPVLSKSKEASQIVDEPVVQGVAQLEESSITEPKNGLTDVEMIEFACKTIPELLKYNCDFAALDCRVSLQRIIVPEDTVIITPVQKVVKRKYTKKHKKFNKSKKDLNYWCPICLKYIAIGRRHRYTAHMLNHRNIKSYKCDKCTKEFTYGETLSKHKRECDGTLPAPQRQFKILPSLKIKTENTIKPIKVDIKKVKKEPYDVDNDWTDEAKARKQFKIDMDSDPRKSQRPKAANKLLYNMTNDAYHCEICEYQTYKKHQYQVHMMKHFNDRRFECPQCPKKFFENWELNRHLRTVHLSSIVNKRPPPNSYEIDNLQPLVAPNTNVSEATTDDTNDSESALFVKMLEPSVSLTVNNDAIVTPVITPIIQSIESLAEEVVTNTAISFACKICSLSFQSHSLLMSHTQKHRVRPQCKICDKTFASNNEYLEHEKTHTNDYNIVELVETHLPPKLPPKKKKKKKFFCTICNMEFASKDHANIHTGAKPYDCKVCGKEFAAYSTLRKHRWTHLDEPRSHMEEDEPQEPPLQRSKHTCSICSKTFLNRWQINSHTCHSATGETVYRCQICKTPFIGRTALIEHMGVHVNQSGDFYQ